MTQSHIDMNADLTKKPKNNFKRYIFKLMNNGLFVKILENARKHIKTFSQEKEAGII